MATYIAGLQQSYGAIYDDGNVSGTHNIDFNLGNSHKITLTGNVILTFTNIKSGAFYTIIVLQDGIGGHEITWPTSKKAGGSIDLTGTANSTDIVSVHINNSDVYLANTEDFRS
jgi:hypothetical protein